MTKFYAVVRITVLFLLFGKLVVLQHHDNPYFLLLPRIYLAMRLLAAVSCCC